MDEGVAEAYKRINKEHRFRIHVGKWCGPQMERCNGTIHGCTYSIIAALVYTTIQFRYLDETKPTVKRLPL